MTFKFIVAICLSLNISICKSECYNSLFFEHNFMDGYKGAYVKKIPSLVWKDRLVSNKILTNNYETLDFNTKELMLHAHKNDGTLIYRICDKNKNYKKYGSIIKDPLRGYIGDFKNIIEVDEYLYRKQFKLYSDTTIGNIIKFQIEKKETNKKIYRKNNPIISFIIYDIIENLFKLLFICLTSIMVYLLLICLYHVIVNVLLCFGFVYLVSLFH